MDDVKGREVQLGHLTVTVTELPFKTLKRMLARLNTVGARLAVGDMSEATLDGMLEVVSIASGIDVAVLEEQPIRVQQLVDATKVLAEVNGLVEREAADPKEAAATDSTGTTSTPSSPLQPAGPGTSSTS